MMVFAKLNWYEEWNIKDLIKLLHAELTPSFAGQEWLNPTFNDHFFTRSEKSPFPTDTNEEISFLKEWLDKGPVLDLGCGDLRLSQNLIAEFGGLGIDLSFHSLKRVHNHQCLQADYRQLPLKGLFQIIILAFGQICFLPTAELKPFLNNIRRQLLPGGLIYLDLPSPMVFAEMNDQNSWELENQSLVLWSRQFHPDSSILSQRRLIFDYNGKLDSDLTTSYQSYSFFELLELFQQLRLQLVYSGADLAAAPIDEESEWMYFLLRKI